MSNRKRWTCNGYGVPHGGAAAGFLVCSRCRWAPNYRDPRPAPAGGRRSDAGKVMP